MSFLTPFKLNHANSQSCYRVWLAFSSRRHKNFISQLKVLIVECQANERRRKRDKEEIYCDRGIKCAPHLLAPCMLLSSCFTILSEMKTKDPSASSPSSLTRTSSTKVEFYCTNGEEGKRFLCSPRRFMAFLCPCHRLASLQENTAKREYTSEQANDGNYFFSPAPRAIHFRFALSLNLP